MIFLHYRSIEEIDFLSLLGADKIIIVIPRITIRELDKEKSTHKQTRIQERAKKVLQKIEKWLQEDGSIRTGISVVYYDSSPTIPFDKYGLNPNWSDDFLLATIVQFKHENPTAEIYLISQDSGPRLTAQHLGIPALELPQEFMIPVIADPLELENFELKRTVAKLQSALPHLVVCFAGSDPPESHAKFLLQKPLKPIEEEIENKIKELKEKYPKRYPSAIKKTDTHASMAAALSALQSLLPTPPEEYDRYNSDVDKYLSSYEQYMRRSWEIKEVGTRTIQFQIETRNIGTAPADDIDFYFYFPDGFKLFTEEDLPPLPKKPRPPVEPRTQAQILAESIDRFRNFPDISIPRPFIPQIRQPSTFTLRRNKSYELTDHSQRIKHGDFFLFPELFLTFDSFETAASFSCEYTIRPANVPEPLKGKLHFVIEKEK
jgi:hypothetical protein